MLDIVFINNFGMYAKDKNEKYGQRNLDYPGTYERNLPFYIFDDQQEFLLEYYLVV